jgi:hypothetical protein
MSEIDPIITAAMPIPPGDDSSEGRCVGGLPRRQVSGSQAPRPEAYLDRFDKHDRITIRDVFVT